MPAPNQSTVTWYRVYQDGVPPMRADKSALGTLPTMAYRHCEPVRTASGFGWYVFPPESIRLRWDGSDVWCDEGGTWAPLQQVDLPGVVDYWDEHAPAELTGCVPSFLSRMAIPGFVQVWSGLLCSTAPGWSVLVRPLVNVPVSRKFRCFEGIVEGDSFGPFPLFVNLQLLATDTVIELPKIFPLFQVQPLPQATYRDETHSVVQKEGLGVQENGELALSAEAWAGYRASIRIENYKEPEAGRYTIATRKRSKQGEAVS